MSSEEDEDRFHDDDDRSSDGDGQRLIDIEDALVQHQFTPANLNSGLARADELLERDSHVSVIGFLAVRLYHCFNLTS